MCLKAEGSGTPFPSSARRNDTVMSSSSDAGVQDADEGKAAERFVQG
jgi:hypothetical protein